MPDHDLVIQQPAVPAAQLILLFHGMGANASHMQDLGAALASTFPKACVVSVNAPHPSGHAQGYQWFSVVGIDEDSRPARVAQAMPAFADSVRQWQARASVGAEATALIGFSQGAIMALESTRLAQPLCSRMVAISGRFATLPESLPYPGTVHLLHGKNDSVIPYSHAIAAAYRLKALGIDMTAEIRPFTGHEIPPEFVATICSKLSTHVPQGALSAEELEAEQTPKHLH